MNKKQTNKQAKEKRAMSTVKKCQNSAEKLLSLQRQLNSTKWHALYLLSGRQTKSHENWPLLIAQSLVHCRKYVISCLSHFWTDFLHDLYVCDGKAYCFCACRLDLYINLKVFCREGALTACGNYLKQLNTICSLPFIDTLLL